MNNLVDISSLGTLLVRGSLSSTSFSNILAMPAYCQGCYPSGRTCRASRSHPGQKATIKGPCSKCHERRCRRHCQCYRTGVAIGRSAPRSGRAEAAPCPSVEPSPPQFSVVPIGRPAAPSAQLLDETSFYKDLFAELDGAAEVHIATFQYDHPGLQQKLLRGLRGGLRVYMVVDKQGSSTCRNMKVRLAELQKAKGHVWWRSGHSHRAVFGPAAAHLAGHMHRKIIVVDKRVGYIGSMNLTRSAETNRESMCKVKGPIVRDLVKAVNDCILAIEES